MKKSYDLAVSTGTYEQAGETKHRYQNIGTVLEREDGNMFILMDRTFNPAGVPFDPSKGNSIIVSMFRPRARETADVPLRPETPEARRVSPFASENAKPAVKAVAEFFEDDIPF